MQITQVPRDHAVQHSSTQPGVNSRLSAAPITALNTLTSNSCTRQFTQAASCFQLPPNHIPSAPTPTSFSDVISMHLNMHQPPAQDARSLQTQPVLVHTVVNSHSNDRCNGAEPAGPSCSLHVQDDQGHAVSHVGEQQQQQQVRNQALTAVCVSDKAESVMTVDITQLHCANQGYPCCWKFGLHGATHFAFMPGLSCIKDQF